MMSKNDVAIEVKNVSKYFLLPHQKASSVKSFIVNPFARYDNEKQHALEDVSFEIKKGEFFGIVGRNGSGKSTLLKCMAGVYTPDKGRIKVNGTLVPFIELGVGFNPELSGRDNVYLNGALLGFSRTEVDAMYDEIVEFAELKEFMDQKLKNYSSGMQVRLAFSIAIRADGDILLLDEVLAVGDAAFQQKCNDYFAKLKKSNRTIVLVSHNMQAIERFCDRAILIDSGKILKQAPSSEISMMYDEMFFNEEAKRQKSIRLDKQKEDPDSSEIEIDDIQIVQNGKTTEKVNAWQSFDIVIELKSYKKITKADIGINVKNQDNIMVFNVGSGTEGLSIDLKAGGYKKIKFSLPNYLKRGLYSVNVGVADNSGPLPKAIARFENQASFIVEGRDSKALTLPKVAIYVSE